MDLANKEYPRVEPRSVYSVQYLRYVQKSARSRDISPSYLRSAMQSSKIERLLTSSSDSN